MDITDDEDALYRALEENVDDDDDEIFDDADIDEGDADESPCTLMRLIQLYDWAGTLARVASHPEECQMIGVQGRTPLHVACNQDAPAVVIQALLKAYPEGSVKTGTTNMNPLHITCSSQYASVHIVRVFLECGRLEQFSMRDVDGDTPLHTACRCGAPIDVLEVLLRAYRAAVYERDYEGLTPVQRLWVRYFVILGDDVIESVNTGADLVGELLDAWNKTELLLRCAHHGPQDITAPGTKIPFRVVHAASSVDCPRAVVRIASKVYPNDLNDRDEHGRTPLMIAASAPIYEVRDLSDKGYTLEDFVYNEGTNHPVTGSIEPNVNNASLNVYSGGASAVEAVPSTDSGCCGYPSVIQILLEANNNSPTHGAHIPDPSGRLPLHLALASGKRWNEGVQQLIAAFPDAVSLPDRSSKLYPFMLAASCGLDSDVTSTYEILRLNPCLIENLSKRSESQQLQLLSTARKQMERVESCEIEITDKLFQAAQL